jgi:CRP-like cAMP-binding protein
MPIDARVLPFLRVPLFEGLKPLQITEIARRAARIIYRPGDVIIKERSEGDAAVLIVAGEAVRVSGPEMSEPAELVPVGALLGEMAMLVETEHSSTVVARTTVRAIKISRAEIHAQMAGDPGLADHFQNKISGRLSRLVVELRRINELIAEPSRPAQSGSSAVSYH